MNPKLSILYLLIGAIIGFSHLNDKNLAYIKQQLVSGRRGKLGRLIGRNLKTT
jgi:hypothetical protein